MESILENESGVKIVREELEKDLARFLEPCLAYLPEQRLRAICLLAVAGILAGQSPVIVRMASGLAKGIKSTWALARRLYRFMWNERFSHQVLRQGLYAVGQSRVTAYAPSELVIAIDPVNFEKAYTEKLEGVSTVYKSTPPGPQGKARLTAGYPAITACVVNLPEPIVTYAHWFSYQLDFLSQNHEIAQAITTTRSLYPHQTLCFVADSGLDDQKVFQQVVAVNADFVIRVAHANRIVEVYNQRLDRWERNSLDELMTSVFFTLRLEVAFTHARRIRRRTIDLAWLKIRLPDLEPSLWLLVIHDPAHEHEIGLLTSRPIASAQDAQQVYTTWRLRPQVEHTYRFDQEAGLDVERIQVQTLERMRRLFLLTLLAALFVYFIDHSWNPSPLRWLRVLGGKLELAADLDGPYLLLAGISAVFITAATLTFAQRCPFPVQSTYG